MIYELWDMETVNVIVSYDDEAAALAVVREAIKRHGTAYVVGLALIREDDHGGSATLAEGEALLAYANADADTRLPVT